MSTLELYGYDDHFRAAFDALDNSNLSVARVLVEHRGGLRLLFEDGEALGEISGVFRSSARDRIELPAVGDWVAAQRPADGTAIIHHVLPRKTRLVRRAPGDREEPQVLAANVDAVFVVAPLDQRFSARRIERFVVLAREGGAEPVLVLSKADLTADPSQFLSQLAPVASELKTVLVSAHAGVGRAELEAHLAPGKTIALIGTSGAGKSTLVNWLTGSPVRATGEVRDHDQRGRHVTSDRALIPLPGGGVLLDTPGLRELQLWDAEEALDTAFPEIDALATQCRFTDCAHRSEPGCAIRGAVDRGELDPKRWASYEKLRGELEEDRLRREAAARGPRARGRPARRR